jgi:TonB-dependent receptor
MVSGSYDYNGRGIDDIEPVPTLLNPNTPGDLTAAFSAMAIRQYRYDRSRYGFGTSVDYRLSDTSNLYVHSLFSDFSDTGHRWEWQINDNGGSPGPNVPSPVDTERRTPNFQVASLSVGGYHALGTTLLSWQVAAGRARMRNPIGGGESHTFFSYIPTTSNCQYDPTATTNPYLPQFTPACYTEAYDPTQFQLSQIQDSAHGKAAQVNLAGNLSVAKNYHIGSHTSTFETGFYIRNAHKFDDSYEIDYCPTNQATAPLMSQFLENFTNPNYYNGHYKIGPTASWEKVNAFFAANRGLFDTTSGLCSPQTAPQTPGNNNNFDLVERVTSGYVMNSLDFNRFRLVAGVRFEGTQDNTVSCQCGADPNNPNAGPLSVKRQGSYIDVLPSASLRIRLDSQNNSALRLVYARGLSRPDPMFLTSAQTVDNSTTPPTVTIGNPAVRAEHAHNFDVLYERYLQPLGAIQAGFFYKKLSDPIVTLQSGPMPIPGCPPQFTSGCLVNQAANSGSAYIAGVELNFQQHFTYLPGLLSGLGLSANYSYATSQAKNVNPGLRIDNPALLRQAPSTFNISPTYDHGRLSARVGMAYNGANIFSYAFAACQNQQVDSKGNCIPNFPGDPPAPTPGGVRGPSGDIYLYSHFQVDAQGSFYLGKGLTFIASGLNLNNEAFGFYLGSPQFTFQREYYKPTFSFGFRWELGHEK